VSRKKTDFFAKQGKIPESNPWYQGRIAGFSVEIFHVAEIFEAAI
jgi:hypothetical protein